jgi:gas vesicle protein
MEFIIGLFIGIVGLVCGFLIAHKIIKVKQRKIDESLIEEEKKLKEEISSLRTEDEVLIHQINIHRQQEQSLEEAFSRRRAEDNKILEEYYEEKRQLIDQQIESEFALSREKLKQNIAELTQLENSRLEESLEKNRADFELKMAEMNSSIENCQNTLSQLQLKRAAAIEDAKRQEEMRTQKDFYKLQITETDLADILELKTVEKKLSKKEVLNKLIYKVYFEKPYTDLAGRVVGKETKTGIYKITNTLNQKVYIGQAVNIAERWKQHIKRALGAEPMTQNKLYPAMAEE